MYKDDKIAAFHHKLYLNYPILKVLASKHTS